MVIGTDNLFIELREHWSHFFQSCNWYSFTPFELTFEHEERLGGISVELCILNFSANFRWNYAPEKLGKFIGPLNTSEDYKRFEIIDHRNTSKNQGMIMSLNDVNIDLSYQDSGHTLKVFIRDDGKDVLK